MIKMGRTRWIENARTGVAGTISHKFFGIGSDTALTTATTALTAFKIQSNFSGNGYHFGQWNICKYTLDGASYGSVRSVVGQVDLSATQTTVGTAQQLIGVHGRAKVSGVAYNSGLFVAGVLGQVLAGGTWTATDKVAAGWFDWQLASAVTAGDTMLLYLTNNANNASYNPTSVMFIYAPYMTNLFYLQGGTVGGLMVSADIGATAIHKTVCRAIRISIDGTAYYLLASTAYGAS